MGTKIIDGVAYETYVVQKGDYLGKIASKYGLGSWQALRDLNKPTEYYDRLMGNPNLIYPGWELLVKKVSTVGHSHPPYNKTGVINGAYECKVWENHNPNSKVLKVLPEGTAVTVTEHCPHEYGGYGTMHIADGWISGLCIDFDDTVLVSIEDNAVALAELIEDINSMGQVSKYKSVVELLVDNMTGIHGMPYQFMDDVDGRLYDNVLFGRKYIERIVTKMPLLLMTPGAPNFMPNFNSTEKGAVLNALLGLIGNKSEIKENLDHMLSGSNQRYYTFKFAYAEYYRYVNAMLRYCAQVLNIGKVTHKTNDYSSTFNSFDWSKAINSKLKGFINAQEYIAFYIDSETSISESFSNNTTSSSLADTINSAASQSKEIQFLLGTGAGIDTGIFGSADPAQETAYQDAVSSISQLGEKYFKGNKLLTNVNEAFETIGRGGKLIFPEIWDESDFSRSYDISQKLRTPDGDKISWYLNIIVPLAHWICLAAPRGMKDSVNAMLSPFLVRAYYKGIFNVDTGIITNLSINKGKEASWTVDGLPTEVDINVTIKDLYGQLTISPTSTGTFGIDYTFFRNTALVDYLCNTCGVNINKQELSRVLETYILWFKNGLQDAVGNIWLSLNESFSNFASNVYGKVLFKK